MKKYGLRIGNVGIEFPSIDDRQKALIAFTKGSDVKININGIKYQNGEGNFSLYDRDTAEVISICELCKGDFLLDTCSFRKYPKKSSWEDNFRDVDDYICDACLAEQIKAKEVFDAKKLLKDQEE